MESQPSAFDTYFERILAERTIFPDKPPSLQPFDKIISSIDGFTFALGLQPQMLQASKRLRRPTYEERLVEIVRETSSYKRELQFFRTVYEAMEDLQANIHSVREQLILNYYLSPNNVSPADNEWLQLADELDVALQKYTTVVNNAAEDWTELTKQHPLHPLNKELGRV